MAIPFNLPSDEETEENYRRLDQLLLDLYDVLRQILLRRRIQRAQRQEGPQYTHHQMSGHHQGQQRRHPSQPQHQPESPRSPQVAAGLPDLVQSAVAASARAPLVRKPPVPPPRRRRRRASDSKQTQSSRSSGQPQQQGTRSSRQQTNPSGSRQLADLHHDGPSWLNVGIELRQIAEEFRSSQIQGSDWEERKRKEIKASSLFSLLVPAPLTGSIWTTVIILVGWRILAARHR